MSEHQVRWARARGDAPRGAHLPPLFLERLRPFFTVTDVAAMLGMSHANLHRALAGRGPVPGRCLPRLQWLCGVVILDDGACVPFDHEGDRIEIHCGPAQRDEAIGAIGLLHTHQCNQPRRLPAAA